MKKPDVFERMVRKPFEKNWRIETGLRTVPEVAKLLRAHHRKVVRMVDNLYRNAPGTQSQFVSYRVACRDILAKLKAMGVQP